MWIFSVKSFNSSVIFIIKRGHKRNLLNWTTDNNNNAKNNHNQEWLISCHLLPSSFCCSPSGPGGSGTFQAWSLCTCFLLPWLTPFHPGLLPIHPLRSLFTLYCPSICNCTPQLLAFPVPCLTFIFLHSTYHNLPDSIAILFIISPHKSVSPTSAEIFIYLVTAGYPMIRTILECSRCSANICWRRNK